MSYIKYKRWQQITKKKVQRFCPYAFTQPLACLTNCHTCSEIPGMLQINFHASYTIHCSSTTLLPAVANTTLLRLPHKHKSSSFKLGDMVGQASSFPYTLDIFIKHISKWLLKWWEKHKHTWTTCTPLSVGQYPAVAVVMVLSKSHEKQPLSSWTGKWGPSSAGLANPWHMETSWHMAFTAVPIFFIAITPASLQCKEYV